MINDAINKVLDRRAEEFAKELDTDHPTTVAAVILPAFPIIGQATDTISTIVGLNKGYQEGNPFMKQVVSRLPLFVALKAAVGIGGALVVHKLQKEGKDNQAKVTSFLLGMVGFGPTLNNLKIIKGNKK